MPSDFCKRAREKAERAKSVDLHDLVERYRRATDEMKAAYARAAEDDKEAPLSNEEWDLIHDRYWYPIYELEIQAEAELKRRHGVKKWDRNRGLLVGCSLIVWQDPDAETRTFASTDIVPAAYVVTVDEPRQDHGAKARRTAKGRS